MPTSWSLTATEMCSSALGHLGVLGAGETASSSDVTLCLQALDGILKELPLPGYSWPKLSAEVALTWAAGAAIALPSDYYGHAVAWKLLNGQRVPLTQINHADWVRMIDRAATGTISHFYISPGNTFTGWPVAAADPSVTVQYQKIVDDAVLATTPDVLQYWKPALPWGIAHELALDYGLDAQTRGEIAQRWLAKRGAALASSIPSETICFEARE
jgi:hypothetical protein